MNSKEKSGLEKAWIEKQNRILDFRGWIAKGKVDRLKESEEGRPLTRKYMNLEERLEDYFKELALNDELTREEKIRKYREKYVDLFDEHAKKVMKVMGFTDFEGAKKSDESDERLNLKFDVDGEMYRYGEEKGIELIRQIMPDSINQLKWREDYPLSRRLLHKLTLKKYPLMRHVVAAEPSFATAGCIYYFNPEDEGFAERLKDNLEADKIELYEDEILTIHSDDGHSSKPVVERSIFPKRESYPENLSYKFS